MRNGILLIDKPAGISSAHVVARVKRALSGAKVGHAGTLDPDATGLLICAVNGATRALSGGFAGQKEYQGLLRLGVRTTTDDMSGEILERSELIPPEPMVSECADKFVGEISQVPPRVSAIRVQGQRAHDLERRGVEFTLDARSVRIFSFQIRAIAPDLYSYSVECSPGTYIRSLARDLGDLLGCGGAVESIRRTRSGGLSVDDAIKLEDVSWEKLHDWTMLYPGTPILTVPSALALGLLGGKASALRETATLATSHGISPAFHTSLIYTVLPAAESWGLLKWGSDGTLAFDGNIMPQAEGRSLLGA